MREPRIVFEAGGKGKGSGEREKGKGKREGGKEGRREEGMRS